MPQRRPTVVHVSTVHRWPDNRIFHRECRSLARNGYDVTLLAVGTDRREVDGVQIEPVTPAPRWRRILLTAPQVARQAQRLRADIYHLHDPELIPMIPLLRRGGARVVYDAHEDLPAQLLDKPYLPAVLRPAFALFARALCTFADRSASHVVTATPAIARRFDQRHTTVVRNYPDLSGFPDQLVAEAEGERPQLAVYVGGLSTVRGAEQMVDAMALLPRRDRRKLLLIGGCAEAGLVNRLRSRPGWSRVDYLGEVPAERARPLMATAEVGLVLFQPTQAHIEALPNKLFEYLAAGIPVIASDFPQWRALLAEADCGLLVDPRDPAAIARAIGELNADPARARAMGARGRHAARTRFNWSAEEGKMTELYRELAGADQIRTP